MPIKTTCGKCGATINAPDAMAGKVGSCPKCKAKIAIPMPEAEWEAVELVADHPPQKPRKKKSSLPRLIVGGVAIAFCFFLLIAVVFAGIVYRESQRSDGNPNAAPPPYMANPLPKRTWSRQEFRDALIGKTMDEVKAFAGRPTRTSGDDSERWIYEYFTTDPITGKTDALTWVIFEDGKVVKVDW